MTMEKLEKRIGVVRRQRERHRMIIMVMMVMMKMLI